MLSPAPLGAELNETVRGDSVLRTAVAADTSSRDHEATSTAGNQCPESADDLH
jgi:hypothetical protein